jgi:hypothetical protein
MQALCPHPAFMADARGAGRTQWVPNKRSGTACRRTGWRLAGHEVRDVPAPVLGQAKTKSGTISFPFVSGPRNNARHQLPPPIRQPISIGTENPRLWLNAK